MSIGELKAVIDNLTQEDRLFVSAYLKHLACVDDPAHRDKLGARMRRMDAGKKVSLQTVQQLHRRLEKAGL